MGELTLNILGDGRLTWSGSQKNARNGKIHGSTYLGAGRLAVMKVGDWEIEASLAEMGTPPIFSVYRKSGSFFAFNGNLGGFLTSIGNRDLLRLHPLLKHYFWISLYQ